MGSIIVGFLFWIGSLLGSRETVNASMKLVEVFLSQDELARAMSWIERRHTSVTVGIGSGGGMMASAMLNMYGHRGGKSRLGKKKVKMS